MITSAKNQRIVDARKLTQRKHRLRQNRFVVEGLQLLGLAVEAAGQPGMQPKIVPRELLYSTELFTGDAAPRLLGLLTGLGAEAIAVAPHVLDTLSDRDTSQGLLATFALRELEWNLGDLISGLRSKDWPLPGVSAPDLLLILDRLQDPGNLGTLIRTADAVGVRAVMLLEPCVDPFDPKTVRGTMGSIFNVPFARATASAELWSQLAKAGYRLVGAAGERGRGPWESEALIGPVALVLGNEARGLSPELHPHLVDYVSLPLRGRAESLNVAVAGGALMYEWLRVNHPSGL